MHIGQIFKADTSNGIGVRVSLFVSGCTNHCQGCFQPETWDFNYGHEYNENIEMEILTELSHEYYNGLTILGGEPFEPSNQRVLAKLIQRIKKSLPNKTIWMYTGFIYEDLVPGGKRYIEVTDEILNNIDILVDGKFDIEKANISLKFKGSSNQRIIDMVNTRTTGVISLSPLDLSV